MFANDDDSDIDPDFNPSSSSSEQEDPEPETLDINQHRENVRKRVSKPLLWHKNQAKKKRNTGLEYISVSSTKKKIPARKMGSPCNSCKLKCDTKFSDSERAIIFSDYWALGDLQRQRDYILQNMEMVNPKYNYIRVGDDGTLQNRRANNHAFYFMKERIKIRVCKVFFKNTLGINDRPIRTVISKLQKSTSGTVLEGEKRGKHGNSARRLDESMKIEARNHIMSIPRVESHYCRQNTQREFIYSGKTLADLHRDYVDEMTQKNLSFVNYLMYSTIFKTEFNISFFVPKKDQCEDCTIFQNSNEIEKQQLQSSYENHLLEKDLSRMEMEKDKKTAKFVHVAVYDLQAALPCPQGNASGFYYVSKLSVYNFTVYDLKKDAVKCYVWHEAEGNRGVNEIASCVYNYLLNLKEESDELGQKLDIIFYSDNCCGQQKNYFMQNMYNFAIQTMDHLNSITHKYLIKGHTQNKGDVAHSMIEKKIKLKRKNEPIYLPETYFSIIRNIKLQNKHFQVHEMSYTDFMDIKSLNHCIPTGSIKITEVRVIQFTKEGIFSKDSYGSDFIGLNSILKTRKRRNETVDGIPPAYATKPTIAEKKKKSLIGLIEKRIIPAYYMSFYANL